MKRFFSLVPAVGILLAASLAAQTTENTSVVRGDWQTGRSFAVVQGSSMRIAQGEWGSSTPLFRYVHDHPAGNYVVFEQNGGVYRLDKPAALAEVHKLYGPMYELSARQEALAHAQKPLAKTQGNLGQEQRGAGSPEEQGRIGQAQGTVGQEQGDIGSMQGEIGRQQGAVAKTAYKRMQVLFDQCLADGSCPRISS